MENFIFELLAIDKDGAASITREDSLVRALLFSEDLWIDAKEEKMDGASRIFDKEQGVEVRYHALDANSVLNDSISSAFIISISCDDFKVLEAFRNDFLVHLKSKLKFSNIKLLRDDISTEFTNKLYPLINGSENLLRRYLIKFFTQKIGLDWWETAAPAHLIEKINAKKKLDQSLNHFVDLDIDLIDFEDLGELIYKQDESANRHDIISRIMSVATLPELETLKEELKKDDMKGFKETFYENHFEKKWKRLHEIRNKVAHNSFLTNDEFAETETLVNSIKEMINIAESKIGDFKFTAEEQAAIKKATVMKAIPSDYPPMTDPSKMDIKVLGKIDLSDYDKKNAIKAMQSNKIIAVEELKKELEYSERIASLKGHKFISLKFFVTKILADKGFAIGPTYSIVNILRDQGEIDIYDYEDGTQVFPVKAIKLANSKFDNSFNTIGASKKETAPSETPAPATKGEVTLPESTVSPAPAIIPSQSVITDPIKVEENLFSSNPDTFDFF